jgi:hypothetical protein
MGKTGHVAFIREMWIKYRNFVVKPEGKTIIGTLPHIVDCTGDKLTVNWEGSGRKWCGLIQVIILEFAWNDWGKPQQPVSSRDSIRGPSEYRALVLTTRFGYRLRELVAFAWLWTGTGGGVLWTRWLNFGFIKRRKVSSVATLPPAFQQRICSMKSLHLVW